MPVLAQRSSAVGPTNREQRRSCQQNKTNKKQSQTNRLSAWPTPCPRSPQHVCLLPNSTVSISRRLNGVAARGQSRVVPSSTPQLPKQTLSIYFHNPDLRSLIPGLEERMKACKGVRGGRSPHPKLLSGSPLSLEWRHKPLMWSSLSAPALASCQTPASAPCVSQREPRGQLPRLACTTSPPEAPPRRTQPSVSVGAFSFHHVLLAILFKVGLQACNTKPGPTHSFIPPAVA